MKCYSVDGEVFNFTNLQDLIDYMEEPEVGSTYFEGDAERLSSSDAINQWSVASILEDMDELVQDALGGYEGYDNDCTAVGDEAREELRALLEAWAGKHINISNYWKVKSVRELKLTADDLGDAA